jgi:hypothetical protein
MYRCYRASRLAVAFLVGMLGFGTSLAPVVSAQDEPVAAMEVAETADAGGTEAAAIAEADRVNKHGVHAHPSHDGGRSA